MNKNNGILTTILITICFLLMGISGFFLIDYYMEREKAENAYNNIAEEVFTTKQPERKKESPTKSVTLIETDTLIEKPTEPIQNSILLENYNHKALLNINQDAVGYLQIPAVNITLPVVQGVDNEYYLTHTFQKAYNSNGCLFIDVNNESFLDKNCIIYGHNMKNGAMFGSLHKINDELIKEKDENQYIYFYNKDTIYQYQIYSIHTTPANKSLANTYQIYYEDVDAFLKYVNDMQSKSYISSDYLFDGTESTITLSTCTGDKNTRFVVQAVLINEMDLLGNIKNTNYTQNTKNTKNKIIKKALVFCQCFF